MSFDTDEIHVHVCECASVQWWVCPAQAGAFHPDCSSLLLISCGVSVCGQSSLINMGRDARQGWKHSSTDGSGSTDDFHSEES